MSEIANENFSGEKTSNITAKKSLEQLTGCKKPSKAGLVATQFLTGIGGLANKKYKAKMTAYKECLAKYEESVARKGDMAAKKELDDAKKELDDAQAESLKSSTAPTTTDSTTTTPTDEKLLGMPKKVAYVVIGLGVLALAFGGYKAFQHFKK